MPNALVIRAAGTNCDAELMRAFELAGARAELMHLDALLRDPSICDRFELFGFPGGFSFGDDIASGRIFAMKVRTRLYPALREALMRGCPMIGVCNGFQVLVQTGLLPGAVGRPGVWPITPPPQTVALSENQDARFHDRWVGVRYERESVCVWTRGLEEAFAGEHRGVAMQLPAAHGEGRLVASSPEVIASMQRAGQIALRYEENYNGSQDAIAGICDASGLVLGLMPHPERFLDWNRHPRWTSLSDSLRTGDTPGQMLFRNAVELVASSRQSGIIAAR